MSPSPALPQPVQTALDQFCTQLQDASGEDLVSILLYGDLVEGESFSDSSQVNVMVVLQEISVTSLDRLAGPIATAVDAIPLVPFVLSEADLTQSTDVFPIKFLNIQRHHHLLYGRDVFDGLEIARDHLRLRCEQEIKNLMLRLRLFYLGRSQNPEGIQNTLSQTLSPFTKNLGILVELKTGAKTPPGPDEIFHTAASLGIDIEPLKQIQNLKQSNGAPKPEELKTLYNGFMKTVREAAGVVDSM